MGETTMPWLLPRKRRQHLTKLYRLLSKRFPQLILLLVLPESR